MMKKLEQLEIEPESASLQRCQKHRNPGCGISKKGTQADRCYRG